MNKSILLSIILLVLALQTQAKSCKINSQHYHDFNDQFQGDINRKGIMDLYKYGFDFYTNAPMPKENTLFTFQLMIKDSGPKEMFKAHDFADSNVYISTNNGNFNVQITNGNHYLGGIQIPQRFELNGNIPRKMQSSFVIVAIYISKEEARLYINGKKVDSTNLNTFYYSVLDYFSNENDYTISPYPVYFGGYKQPKHERNYHTYMRDIAVFRDLEESQVLCLTKNSDLKIQDFLETPQQENIDLEQIPQKIQKFLENFQI